MSEIFEGAAEEIVSGSGLIESRVRPFGFATVKGKSKEECHEFHVAKEFEQYGCFAVMEGKGGPHVAKYLADHLFHEILRESNLRELEEDSSKVLRDAILKLDKRILEMGEESEKWRAGSTATIVLLSDCGSFVEIVSVGGCRAVLSDDKGKLVDPCCGRDWHVYECDEEVRSELEGRAIGEHHLKESVKLEQFAACAEMGYDTECVVIASRGFWDVMSRQEVIDYINLVGVDDIPCEDVVRSLVSSAVKKDNQNDITCIVVWM